LLSGKLNLILPAWRHWRASVKDITVGSMFINKDFKEFIQLLNEHKVRYLIVGGYAVALHGNPRYTKDLD
jgi:DNA polymerase II small subunit/DNA polymerase delta subunit B